MGDANMKRSFVWTRAALALAGGLATFSLWGCPNPNAIGLQEYGSLKIVCVQASNQQPVANAQVSAPTQNGQTVQSTDASGSTTFAQVVIGTHTIVADAPGLHGEAAVTIVENTATSLQISMSPSN